MSYLFKLVADGKMSAEHLSQIRTALNKELSPHIHKVELDFDEISDEHMMELINATHQSSLTQFKLGLGTVNENLAQSMVEVGSYNKNIGTCWLLLGQHQFYYRDKEMGEVSKVLHFGYAKQVTIDCQSMTALQVEQLIAKVNQCNVTQDLTLKIANLHPDAAFLLTDALNANEKLTKLSLNINGEVSGFDRTIDHEVVQMFSTLMQTAESEVIAASATATRFVSGLLGHGKAILNAFTAPIAACAGPAPHDDLLADIPPSDVSEKEESVNTFN